MLEPGIAPLDGEKRVRCGQGEGVPLRADIADGDLLELEPIGLRRHAGQLTSGRTATARLGIIPVHGVTGSGSAVMQATLRKAVGVTRWAGLLGRRAALGKHVVVVSPHLDDAVFSLGAAIACATRKGADVTVLTVLAGDPTSAAPAGPWDARAGFATEGEAATARRLEDEQACGLVRARPLWLSFSDKQYDRGGDEDEVRRAVVDAVGDAQVVLPGFPLLHEDHAWLRRVLDGAFAEGQASLYTEQPYAAAWSEAPGVDGSTPRDGVPAPAAWRRVGAALPDQLRKIRACQAYGSQLPLIGDGIVASILRYELRVGGEAVARLEPAQ